MRGSDGCDCPKPVNTINCINVASMVNSLIFMVIPKSTNESRDLFTILLTGGSG